MAKEHSELLCHAAGERRQNYLNQIKCILDQLDDTPCTPKKPFCETGKKPLIKYPGYLDMKNPRFAQPYYIPLITNVQIKELRPTSEYIRHISENDEKLQYYPVSSVPQPTSPPWHRPRYNSFEIRGGRRIFGCQCAKHNGIQDQCERTDCHGSPECLTEPSPTCKPSQTYSRPRPLGTIEERFARALEEHPPKKKNLCCCTHIGKDVKEELPSNFECFPCTYH